MSDLTGKSISHYRIIKEVGRGGMGVVYRAEDTQLHRQVEVNILPPMLMTSVEDRVRFFQEARLISSLSHPNIAAIHDFGEADGVAFIVTELAAGRTLASMISSGPLPLPQILDIANQVAEGIREAHTRGILHRDLKPDNIIVSHADRAMIMNFGLARLVGSSHVTDAGNLVGTFMYMSPEQVDDEAIDERSDIFSFGILLYHMIAGAPPFRGKTVGEVLTSIAKKKPEPLRRYRDDVPGGLERIVLKALQKEPDRRYSSMAELLEDLVRLREQPEIHRLRRRHLLHARHVVLLGGLLLSLIVAGYFLFTGTDRSPRRAGPESIAVMPFLADEGSDSLNFLSVGLADDIITRLSSLRGLIVKPTSAIAAYAGRRPAQVAQELGVDYILEGRYRRKGPEFIVNTQMIDARSDNVLWADQSVWPWREIGSVNNALADRILNALQLEVTKAEYARVHKVRTMNPGAYEDYLRGIVLTIHDSRTNNEMAMRLLERAIAQDEGFAEACAALSEVYTERFWSGYSADTAWLSRGEATARRALQLDDRLAVAHAYLGFALRVEGRYGESIREAIRALDLDPHTSFSLEDLCEFYRNRGDFDKAEMLAARAAEIDPSFNLSRVRARLLQFQGKYRESVAEIDRAIQASPSDSWLRGGLLAYSYIHLGEPDKARAEIRTADSLDGEKPETRITSAMLWTLQGDYARAQRALDSAGSILRNDYAASYYAAAIYAKQGRTEKSLECIENAVDRGNRWYSWYADPWFDSVRGHPRFRQLMERMKSELDGIETELRTRHALW